MSAPANRCRPDRCRDRCPCLSSSRCPCPRRLSRPHRPLRRLRPRRVGQAHPRLSRQDRAEPLWSARGSRHQLHTRPPATQARRQAGQRRRALSVSFVLLSRPEAAKNRRTSPPPRVSTRPENGDDRVWRDAAAADGLGECSEMGASERRASASVARSLASTSRLASSPLPPPPPVRVRPTTMVGDGSRLRRKEPPPARALDAASMNPAVGASGCIAALVMDGVS
jgi:hypothetical protein